MTDENEPPEQERDIFDDGSYMAMRFSSVEAQLIRLEQHLLWERQVSSEQSQTLRLIGVALAYLVIRSFF